MRETELVDELVVRMVEGLRGGLDALLRPAGAVFPPMVHVLCEDLDPPVVALLWRRPVYSAADAAAAVAELGELPSALMATRLLVAWEAQDLAVSLGHPPDRDSMAMVALDATLTEQTVHWHPFRLHPREDRGVLAEWGESVALREPPLPGPVARLLAVWRQWRDTDLNDTVIRLRALGHRLRWVESYR